MVPIMVVKCISIYVNVIYILVLYVRISYFNCYHDRMPVYFPSLHVHCYAHALYYAVIILLVLYILCTQLFHIMLYTTFYNVLYICDLLHLSYTMQYSYSSRTIYVYISLFDVVLDVKKLL